MSTDDSTRLRAAVDELVPVISGQADRIEQDRRLPSELLTALKQAGCFRMFVPRSHGGLGLDARTGLSVLETLARADGATGWTVMLGSEAPHLLALLDRDRFDEAYADSADVIVAGGFNPQGQAAVVDGGYLVDGRWAFATGCEHADWIFGNCVVTADGKPLTGPDGAQPLLRAMLFPADEVQVHDTWQVLGLRGTGSHDVGVQAGFCPQDRSMDIFTGRPQVAPGELGAPLVQFVLHMGAVAVGIAQGALDETVRAAAEKQRLYARATLADSPVFQTRIGRAVTAVHAARTLLHDLAADLAAALAADPDAVPGFSPRASAALAWVTETAVAAVDDCYRAGGGGAARDSSRLQRRFRDIHTFSQHAGAAEGFLTTHGAALLGGPVTIGY